MRAHRHLRTDRRRLPTTLAAIGAVALIAAGGLQATGRFAGPSGATAVVRQGDTLSAVAARVGVSVADLAAANGIDDPDLVFEGQVLRVPNGVTSGPGRAATTYAVRSGDTLAAIAGRFGVTVGDIVRANGIDHPNLVREGKVLTIPMLSAPSRAGLPDTLVAHPARLALRPRFAHWAAVYGVPADLFEAMTYLESGWQNGVVSSTGAVGVGQLMPDTVDLVAGRLIGVPLDPRTTDDNIRMSARYLRYLLDRTGRADLALAAYYQGWASVQRDGQLSATRSYVAAVLALQRRFR